MTNRLHTTTTLDWARYDTLVLEATTAFEQDVVYAIQIVESARSISNKKRRATKKIKQKI